MSQPSKYAVETINHFGVVAGIIKDLGIVDLIDQRLGHYEGERISAGETIAGMIINGLGFSNKPLSLTPMFFENCPLSLLFHEGVEADDFNRFKLGRVLDRSSNYGTDLLFSEIALSSCQQEGIDCKFTRLDTTNFSLSGDYIEDTDEKAIHITYGHSKAHRPDLKQVVLEMMVAGDYGIPLIGKTWDGNASDNTVFKERSEELIEVFKQSDTPRYLIADCKLYTSKNAVNLNKLPFVTRIPQAINKTGEIIEQALAQKTQWEEIDDTKSMQTFEITHYGIDQRWIVVTSITSKERAEKQIKKQVTKESESIKKQCFHLQAERFACQTDAEKVAIKISKEWSYHELDGMVFKEIKSYEGQGRPKKDQKPTSITCQITIEFRRSSEEIQKRKDQKGCYVIGTNIPAQELSSSEIITAYQEQHQVERGFRFLKDPLFFTSSLFVKKPSRISGLLMVMLLSLLVYSIAERRLRKQMKKLQETLPNQIKKPSQTPTLRWVFQLLQGIHRIKITSNHSVTYVFEGISNLRRKILSFFGETVALIYLHSQNEADST